MNRIILKAAAIALPMMLGTAIADEAQHTQDALNGVVPMSASELATVTGTGWGEYCTFCSNYAAVAQANVSAFSAFVAQSNYNHIDQENN